MNGKEIVNELIKEKIDSLEKEQKRYIELSDKAYKVMKENSDKGFELKKQIIKLKGELYR